MSLISAKCSFVQCEETNMCFVLFICVIFVRKIFSCSKLMMLNNFDNDFFPLSCTVFELKTLTQNFAARWRCKGFHCVAHGHFTMPRYHFHDDSSFRSKIFGVATDFRGHTEYWAMLGNDYKCIFDYVSWFISIILSFNAWCDAHTV